MSEEHRQPDLELDIDDPEGEDVVSIDDEMHEIVRRIEADEEGGVAAEGADAQAAGDQPAGELQRGPDGKFLPRDATAAPGSAPAAATTTAAAPNFEQPPQSVRPQIKAMWKDLPPEVKEEFHKREQDFFNGINQYQSKARVADTLVGVISPFKPIMDALGTDVPTALKEVLQTAATLYVGSPAQKAAILRNLAQNHGIQLASPAPGNPAAASPMDPVVQRLQQRLGMVEGMLTTQATAAQNNATNEAWGKIVAFGNAAEHKYFSDVREIMGRLMMAGIVADGDLAGAYERACQIHPGVKAALETERLASAAVTSSMERARRANAARRAGQQGVRSNPGVAPLAGRKGSMEDTMWETLKDIQARG
jgi:hypothetical protein